MRARGAAIHASHWAPAAPANVRLHSFAGQSPRSLEEQMKPPASTLARAAFSQARQLELIELCVAANCVPARPLAACPPVCLTG